MQQFQITLKNEKVPLYNRISWFLIIINLALLVYLGFSTNDKHIRNSGIASVILFAILFGIYFYFKKTIYAISIHWFLFLLMMAWINHENYWLAGVIFIFELLYTTASVVQVIFISEKQISYSSIYKKNTSWDKLTNLIIKDGVLTLDFKNNKIIQQTIDETKTSVDEKEFNEFCNEQLNKSQRLTTND